MLDDPMTLTLHQQMVMAHYNQFWGIASAVYRYAFSDQPQDAPFVAEFALGADDDPLYVYATLGMSDAPFDGAPADERAELFVYSSQPVDEIRQTLALLATYPFRNHLKLAPFDIIYGGRAFIAGSRLSSVLLTLPVQEPDEFALIELGDYRVQMLAVTPISEAEQRLCAEQGPLALLDLFTRQPVDLADLARESAL
ncbi:MAG: suppressor of fused domain protein [Chloroflexi bacterium]|nr:suppressor of fused domain protein [Chloroflexota bacterium]